MGLFSCFCAPKVVDHDIEIIKSIDHVDAKLPSEPTYQIHAHAEPAEIASEKQPSPETPQPLQTPPTLRTDVDGIEFVIDSYSGKTVGILNSSKRYSADRPVKIINKSYEELLEDALKKEQEAMDKLRSSRETATPPALLPAETEE